MPHHTLSSFLGWITIGLLGCGLDLHAVCEGARCMDAAAHSGTEDKQDAPTREDSAVELPVCSNTVCGDSCCTQDQLCFEETCIDRLPCDDNQACEGDTYCESAEGVCVPFAAEGPFATDPSCRRETKPGVFAPGLQCSFGAAPIGDPFPRHVHVLSTPMVLDFAIGRDPDGSMHPSIVAVFDDGADGESELPTGVIRVLDGQTCEQQAELGSLQMVSHSSPPALGDLNGDGRAEVIANKANGGLVAFTYDTSARGWRVLWRSTLADGVTPYDVTGAGWAGPTLVDLDNDTRPEILRGAIVLDSEGRLVDDASLGLHSQWPGLFAVALDVDSDGRVEYIAGDGVWEWDPATGRWSREVYAVTRNGNGLVAVADFGPYPGAADWPSATPEIVVVGNGAVRVQTLDGTIVFGPISLPGGGLGGPPTVGDFDGDGRPEFAAAGATQYSVFDLDCGPGAVGTCTSATTNGVLWSQPSQDASSAVTGSSIFDFEGDGKMEAVYGDECFLRVYDGATGDVLFSQPRSSCTWMENPVIADVDGDFNAEIVIGDNYNCGNEDRGINCPSLDARQTDPLFAGLRCLQNDDCDSGACSDGFCRCQTDSDCCSGEDCASSIYVCEAPPAGTLGEGNTCRASRAVGTKGIRVYRDLADNWVRSRPVWNQHAYYVTNVEDNGTVPASSAASPNWLDPQLNDFRQNVQGQADLMASPDLTIGELHLDCDTHVANLTARVCNRGTEPVSAGTSAVFFGEDGTTACATMTAEVLEPGACEQVGCAWAAFPTDRAQSMILTASVDIEAATAECRENNNVDVMEDAYCETVF